jgi:ABC-type polysaccharide/polyol phosphate export permease
MMDGAGNDAGLTLPVSFRNIRAFCILEDSLLRIHFVSHNFYALEQLVIRDFKVRYRNMSLGVFWSLLNPLVLVAVYTFIFTRVFTNPKIEHFPLYLLIGVICFNYFSMAWTAATYSLTFNSGLVKRVKVPREAIPISSVLANAIHFMVQFSLVLAFTLWLGIPVGLSWLWLPVVIVLLILAVAGISLLTSALDVYFRDTRYIVESAVLVLFWLTPVFYSEKMVPAEYRTLYLLNPLADAAIAMRQIIIEQRAPDLAPLAYAAASACVLLMVGFAVFEETKSRFADHL